MRGSHDGADYCVSPAAVSSHCGERRVVGKGFTEWTNVVKAKPLFKGHYQPHFPADLGFYDLRVPEVREAQAELAKAHGISGFCYYHCWFQGRRLLGRSVDEILRSGRPDFPFCLCWANERWTRGWLGQERDVLTIHMMTCSIAAALNS
jgi:lipopolysaccharide biosynthesis protein